MLSDQFDCYFQTFARRLLTNYDSVLDYFQGDLIVHANGRYKLDLTCHCTDVCGFYFQQTPLMKILNTHSFRLVTILKLKMDRLHNGFKFILTLYLIFVPLFLTLYYNCCHTYNYNTG